MAGGAGRARRSSPHQPQPKRIKEGWNRGRGAPRGSRISGEESAGRCQLPDLPWGGAGSARLSAPLSAPELGERRSEPGCWWLREERAAPPASGWGGYLDEKGAAFSLELIISGKR